MELKIIGRIKSKDPIKTLDVYDKATKLITASCNDAKASLWDVPSSKLLRDLYGYKRIKKIMVQESTNIIGLLDQNHLLTFDIREKTHFNWLIYKKM